MDRVDISGESDAALLARSMRVPSAFDEVFTRHAPSIFAFARIRVGPDLAEDVTAETFTTAFAARARFDASFTSARPWLYGIAANVLRSQSRAEATWLQRQRLAPPDMGTDDADSTDTRIDAARDAHRLAAALAELTQAERDVLLLHVFGDLTHREIAATLDIRRGTAKTRLSRGCARLRDHFADDPSPPTTTGAPDAART